MLRRQMLMLAGVVLYFAASALANDGDVLRNLPRWNELYSQEKYTEAEALARQMYASMTTPYGRARAMHLVSVSLIPQQRFEEGERLLRETLDAARNTDVARQELMGNIHDTHGLFLHELGRYEEAEKEYRQAIAILSRTAGPDSTLLARAGLARLAMQQGDLADAEREYGQLVSMVRKAGGLDDEQRYSQLNMNLLGWAQCAMEQGRFDLAEPRYRETLTLCARRWGENAVTSEAASNLAACLMSQNRYEDARPLLEWALRVAETSHGKESSALAPILSNLGLAYDRLGRGDEAVTTMQRAVQVAESGLGEESNQTIDALLDLGVVYGNNDKIEQAEPVCRRALNLAEKVFGPESIQTAHAARAFASVLGRYGRFDDAAPLASRARAIFAKLGANPEFQCDCYRIEANQLWQQGKRDEALKMIESAMHLAEQQRTRSGGSVVENADLFAVFHRIFETMVAWQFELENVDAALAGIERWRARSFLDELQLANADIFAGRTPAERAAIQKRELELRGTILRIEGALDRLPDGDGSKQQRSELLQELANARLALYEYWRDVRSSSEVYRELITAQQKLPTVTDIRSQLIGEKGMALIYLAGIDGTYLVTITAEGASVASLQVSPDDAPALGVEPGPLDGSRLQSILTNDESQGVVQQLSKRDSALAAVPRLARLWSVLVPEAQRKALTDGSIDHLVVIPDGAISMLPLEALVVRTPTADGEEPLYFLDAGPPITYGPSASVLMNLSSRSAATPAVAEPVLTLGDPAYPQAPAQAGRQGPRRAQQPGAANPLATRARADSLRLTLSRLPYSGTESRWVAEVFEKNGVGATSLLGAEATEANVRKQIAGRRFVHLACHGGSDDAYGNFFGALMLAPGASNDPTDDGTLTLPEIYELPVEGCELAITSACMTNHGPQQGGEAVWAISRGFLVAGARRVVASNWVVDDEAGASLISYYASQLAKAQHDGKKVDYATTLRDAKRWVRTQDKWKSPFFWSTFELLGPN